MRRSDRISFGPYCVLEFFHKPLLPLPFLKSINKQVILHLPLISIIIPCYNLAKYLPDAVESILHQSYRNFEIIVVDDGSVDDTAEVAKSYNQVKYIYQQNSGLSSARNTGIKESKGELLVFLDADDWLLDEALSTNLQYLNDHTDIAFVSGAHIIIKEPSNEKRPVQKNILSDHYCHLLESNYIGMPAAVMFRRWVFDIFQYDTTLKSCEDYDIHLKVARDYPVISHTTIIAAYRFHGNNMSGNYQKMLYYALLVLNRQKKLLRNNKEKEWFNKGIKFWKSYYTDLIYKKLYYLLFYENTLWLDKKDLRTLKENNKPLFDLFMADWKNELKIRVKEKSKNIIKKLLFKKSAG